MAFIKKFRNGRPVDPTDPEPIMPLTPPSPNVQSQQQKTVQQPTPTPTPQIPKNSSPPVRNVITKKGGCGCGRK